MTLHDLSYAPWNGETTPRWRRIAAMVRMELAVPFRNVWILLFVLLSFTIVGSLLLILFFAASSQMLPPFAVGNRIYRERFFNNPMLLTILVALSATVGSPLIARDLRHRSLVFYFSRAIGRGDYLLAKVLSLVLFLLCVTLGPALLLWAGQGGMTQEKFSWTRRLGDLGAVFAHSLILAVPMAAAVTACSSLTRRPYLAAILWSAFYFGTQAFSLALPRVLKSEWPKLLSWQNLTAHLGDFLYPGDPVKPALDCGWAEPLIILVGLTVLSLAVAFRRLRSVEAEE
jgi:hypothetical protein